MLLRAHSTVVVKLIIIQVESPRAAQTCWLLTDFFNWSLGWCTDINTFFSQLCNTGLSAFLICRWWVPLLSWCIYVLYFSMFSMAKYFSLYSQMETVKWQSSVSRITLEEINVVDGRKRVMVWTRAFHSPIATTASTFLFVLFRCFPTLPITEHVFFVVVVHQIRQLFIEPCPLGMNWL